MFDGLLTEFGDRRVKDTPIAEQAIIGLGVGAAARGLRPVCDLMFMDFVGVAMDQIFNQAAKMKYMFGGNVSVPLTITTAGGAGMSAAAQHSQSLEAWLAHVPGLKVAMPASAYDAKGLIVGAIRDDNPTIVVLNKRMLGVKGHVPEEIYAIPFGVANVVREGSDVTIVAIGRMVPEATKAAAKLAEQGISVEIIDPRTVQPLDTDDDRRVGQQDEPGPDRARGRRVRRHRCRDLLADPGVGVRLPRCTRRAARGPLRTGALRSDPGERLRPRCAHASRPPSADSSSGGRAWPSRSASPSSA